MCKSVWQLACVYDQSEEMCDSTCARFYTQGECVCPRTSVWLTGRTWVRGQGRSCVCVHTAGRRRVCAVALGAEGSEGAIPRCAGIEGPDTSRALRAGGSTPSSLLAKVTLQFSGSPAHWSKPACPAPARQGLRLLTGCVWGEAGLAPPPPSYPGHRGRGHLPGQPESWVCIEWGWHPPRRDQVPSGQAQGAGNSPGCGGTSGGWRQAQGGAHSSRGETEWDQIYPGGPAGPAGPALCRNGGRGKPRSSPWGQAEVKAAQKYPATGPPLGPEPKPGGDLSPVVQPSPAGSPHHSCSCCLGALRGATSSKPVLSSWHLV